MLATLQSLDNCSVKKKNQNKIKTCVQRITRHAMSEDLFMIPCNTWQPQQDMALRENPQRPTSSNYISLTPNNYKPVGGLINSLGQSPQYTLLESHVGQSCASPI